ncbi:NAD(P)H-dependent oxidoreductase [Methanococcoides methylutens]|uniref:Glutathione-regulated potassium-efflux system ancillary protein KefG n=1 Tax=Methanococcoides methylutens MM1 TaxID=1434104 RepID=A0A0E3SRU0_METMT|nr:NAD(P)H-dependent oxidoreductase [Methanococcoides methylutens]AKB85113.1 Glutathione-regulated potassium-efflux system ancillary protein KefG [Methanococcoides methylutens MM1]
MNRILINFAHPSRPRSKINNALRAAVEDLENVTINDLYANYPDFLIDIKREQSLCEDHDIIIFQHPFYWFSTPSIMKEWLDLVLEHGWAYGLKGKALEGKIFLQSITAGGDDSTYREGGCNIFTIRELISPYYAMAKVCRMKWLPPFTVLGIHGGLSKEKVNAHVEDYRRTIIALRDETLDIEKAQQEKYLNSDLNSIIRRS